MGDYKDFFGFYWDICANYIWSYDNL
jgi:hypothetical protein